VSRNLDVTPDGGATGFACEPGATLFVGRIESVVGACTLVRPGELPVEIKIGDPLCQDHIIETSAGGRVGIRFIDGTVFNLSDRARLAVKEFTTGASPNALFDVSNGTFAFIAGQMAKAGHLGIETPFGKIRGRSGAGGIGMLSLVSLFFAGLENAKADDSNVSHLDDGQINYQESQDFRDAPVGTIELIIPATATQPEQHIMLGDASESIVIRKLTSSTVVSYVQNSLSEMLRFGNAANDAIHLYSLGQSGPAGLGNGGSSGLPPEFQPFSEHNNFNQPPGGGAGPLGGPLPGLPGQQSLPEVIPPVIQNSPPQPIPDTNTIIAKPDNSAVGNVLNNDAVIGVGTLTVINVKDADENLPVPPGSTSTTNGQVIHGLYGTLTIGADGSYNYEVDANNPTVKALGQGDSVQDNPFTYTVTDGTTTAQTTLIITVDGINDAPVANADSNWAKEDISSATGNVLQTLTHDGAPSPGPFSDHADTDIDNGTVLTVTNIQDADENLAVNPGTTSANGSVIHGKYGTLTIGANGSYNYVVDSGNQAVQELGEGETLVDNAFTYTVTDGLITETATLTITVFGTNSAPVANADTNWAIEGTTDATGNVLQTLPHNGAPSSGTFSDQADTDVDVNDTLAVINIQSSSEDLPVAPGTNSSNGTVIDGVYGTLTIGADGSYSYHPKTNISNATDVEDVFTYTVTDGKEPTTTTLTITISDGAGPTVSGTALLTVNEAALDLVKDPGDLAAGTVIGSVPGSTAETALSGGLIFTAGSDNITGVEFSLGSQPILSGAAAGTNLFWMINGSGQLEGHIGTSASDPLAIVLAISGPTTASVGGSVSPTITATLTDNFPHASGSDLISVTGIQVVATDTDGDAITGLASVAIVDDTPTAVSDLNNVTEGSLLTVAAGAGVLHNDIAGADGFAAGGGVVGVRTPGASNDTTSAVTAGVDTDIAGQHGTLHLKADGSYTYQSFANNISSNASDVFVYTIKDGDGDLSTTTLTINLSDVTLVAPTDNDVTVNEAALDLVKDPGDLAAGTVIGSLPGSTAETDASNQLNATGGVGTLHYKLVSGGNAVTAGTFGSIQVNDNGSYVYTLTKPVTEAQNNNGADTVSPAESFTYQVTDDNGNTTTGTINIAIVDDTPIAVPNSRAVVEGTQQSADVQFIVDLSGSMFASGGGGVGFDVPGYSDDRVGLARYSMQQLLSSNDQIENVQIIRFGDSASGTLWLTKAQALAFIQDNANWTSLGGTNYDVALQQAITSFGSGPASPSQQSIVYFMSDGAPTTGGGITTDGSGNNVSIAEWENHITSKGIDQVFAIGIGNGVDVDNLEPIAYPNTDVQPPSGVEDNVILVSTSDVAALPNRLQDALELHSTITGNVLANDPGTSTGADNFGADGGRILSITIAGITYTYDPSGNDISASSGPQPTQNTPVLTVTTALGGTFTFFFATSGANVAGDYTYLTGTTGAESFSYALVDGDGDQATATLSINVLPPPTFSLDLPSLDALQGNGLNKSSSLGTFSGGFTYNLRADSTPGFLLSSDGHLSTGSNNLGNGVYTLYVIGTDSGSHTTTTVVKIWVGTTNNDTFDLATLANASGINLAYGLNGTDVITGNGGSDFIIGGQQSNTLQAGSGPTTLVAGPQGDILKAGTGVDTFYGAGGNDTFVIASTQSAVTVGGSGNNGTISGYDVINGFATANDFLDLQGSPTSATGTNVDGTNSTLTIGGQTVKSHTISNGIITFDDQNGYAAALSLTDTTRVAAVVDYLQHNDLGNAGATVAFTATINGTPHTYIYEQVGNTPNSANDILVDLAGVTLTSGGTSLSTLITNTHVKPAGVAGEPINLALANSSADANGQITVTVGGLLQGWTLNGGTHLSDGSWSIHTTDVQSLTVTPPADFVGALALSVTETWTNADGSTGIKIVTDNLEAYAPESPVFAWSGDDTLTGSSGHDLFAFSQPIGDDAIYGFNTVDDQIDLIGYAGFNSFDDVKNHLTTDANGNAEITLADGQSITLYGVATASLNASNFVFDQVPVVNNAGIMTIADGAILPLSGIINNTGTIELNSAGNTAELELIQHGITLQGGGQLILSDNDQNMIAGAFPDVTLTNINNTISGAGQLGDQQIVLINEGSIVASGSHALTIDTGANVVTNSGTLEATGSGGLIVDSDLSNSGLIWADGGNITINGAVTGSGTALINGATLEFSGTSSANVAFEDGNFGTLVLDNPITYTGQISGFGGGIGSQNSDSIELKGIVFDAGTSWTYSDNAGSDTGGTLTIFETVDGTKNAVNSLTFADGDYTTANFVLGSDGNGGTLITDTPTVETPSSSNNTDILFVSPGALLTGAAGDDTFVFKSTIDSQPGAGQFATITDFTHNSDHIDLSQILGLANIQGQVASANTVDANSISWFVDNEHNETVVYVNATTTANHVDMEIHLTGTNINLTGSDILHHA